MASLIANQFSEATGEIYTSALMAVGAGLFVITVIVNAIARWLVWRMAKARANERNRACPERRRPPTDEVCVLS